MTDHIDTTTGAGDDAEDTRLLNRLGAALAEADPVSDRMTSMAKGLLAWRTVDADLASISADTAVDGLVGVRSLTTTRTVTYSAGESMVELTVLDRVTTTTGAVHVSVAGQVVPAHPGLQVDVRHRDGQVNIVTDEFGAFEVTGIVAGPVRLVVAFPEGPVATEAVVL